MAVLGVISGTISLWPLLSPYRVGNGLHTILDWFKVGLGWVVSACSSFNIHEGGGRDGSSHSIVEAPIFDWDPIGNL